jgi:hypothetical protein
MQSQRTRPREDAKGSEKEARRVQRQGGVTEGVRLCEQETCH